MTDATESWPNPLALELMPPIERLDRTVVWSESEPAMWLASARAPDSARFAVADDEPFHDLALDHFRIEVRLHPATRPDIPDEVQVMLVRQHEPRIGVGDVVAHHVAEP